MFFLIFKNILNVTESILKSQYTGLVKSVWDGVVLWGLKIKIINNITNIPLLSLADQLKLLHTRIVWIIKKQTSKGKISKIDFSL